MNQSWRREKSIFLNFTRSPAWSTLSSKLFMNLWPITRNNRWRLTDWLVIFTAAHTSVTWTGTLHFKIFHGAHLSFCAPATNHGTSRKWIGWYSWQPWPWCFWWWPLKHVSYYKLYTDKLHIQGNEVTITVKPVFKDTWEIGTTWELRTATSVPRSIHYIGIDLKNKTTSEFRTIFDSPLGVPNYQASLYKQFISQHLHRTLVCQCAPPLVGHRHCAVLRMSLVKIYKIGFITSDYDSETCLNLPLEVITYIFKEH